MNQKISLFIMDELLPNSPVVRVNRNHLEDFLDYEAKGTWVTRWEFLQDAMRRFEVGERSFTWHEDGRLLGCAWLCEGRACSAGSSQTQGLTEESILLQSFYFHPAGRPKLQAFLAGLAAAAQNEYKEKRPLYILASQKDMPLCQGLEAVGFRQIAS